METEVPALTNISLQVHRLHPRLDIVIIVITKITFMVLIMMIIIIVMIVIMMMVMLMIESPFHDWN